MDTRRSVNPDWRAGAVPAGRRQALLAGVGGLAIGLLPPPAAAWFWQTPTFDEINSNLAQDYPALAALDVDELQAWLRDKRRPAPVLIDTRSAEEFAVSHLPGALHAQTVQQVQAIIASLPDRGDVVFYCSVGVRSGKLGQAMLEAGMQRLYNLQGSIFEWANRGYPLEQNGQPTDRVHPFNARWGKLLDRNHWSHEP